MSEVLEPIEAAAEVDPYEPGWGEANRVVHFPPALVMDQRAFLSFCAANELLRMERLANGDIHMMSPEGMYSGPAHSSLAVQFGLWAEKEGSGEPFGPDNLFELQNGAIYAPDIAWILKTRLARLSRKQLSETGPICPDFVLELRSKSDRLSVLKAKLEEFVENGARLGWLLDPFNRRAYIYRPGREMEVLQDPAEIFGEDVLPGFVLKVGPVFRILGGD